MRFRSVSRPASAVLFFVLASACGSTAGPSGNPDPRGGLAAEDNGSGDRQDIRGGREREMDLDLSTEDDPAVPNSSAPVLAPSARESAADQPSGLGRGMTGPGGRRPVALGMRGVTDEQITVGFIYVDDAAAASAAIGLSDIDAGDPRRNYETLIAWFNAHGGLAGREITPVYHTFSQASGTPWSVQEQEACETFTRDHEVFALLIGGMGDTFLSCVHRHPVGLVASTGLTRADDRTYQQFPRWLEVNSYSLSAGARLTPAGLDELGFFQPAGPADQVRLGVMTFDNPRFRRALDEDLLPSLRALGHEPVEIAYAKNVNTVNEMGEAAAGVSNAILRFRAAGVGHVMILDDNAILTFLFMRQAEDQGYRPAYGLNSQNGGQVQIDSGLMPPAQFENAKLVGWYEDFDVARSTPPRTWPARERCLQIYAEEGISFDNAGAERTGYQQCDLFFFARAALDATTGPISADSFLEGSAALATGYESALIGPTRFSANKRHGVARYNLAQYFGNCQCLRYMGDWRPVP